MNHYNEAYRRIVTKWDEAEKLNGFGQTLIAADVTCLTNDMEMTSTIVARALSKAGCVIKGLDATRQQFDSFMRSQIVPRHYHAPTVRGCLNICISRTVSIDDNEMRSFLAGG